MKRTLLLALLLIPVALIAQAPATGGLDPTTLLKPLGESWASYSGDYTGRRHSPLTQITPANVSRLAPQWAFQADTIATGRGFEPRISRMRR